MQDSRRQGGVVFTRHAWARVRQRGVRGEALRLVLAEADERRHVGGGAVAEWISRHRRRRLLRDGMPPALVEDCRDIVVVVAPDKSVMTVVTYPKNGTPSYRGDARPNRRRRGLH